MADEPRARAALAVISDQLEQARSARKCHGCGCLHQTVTAIETSGAATELNAALESTKRVFTEKKYDCLGCPTCFPAIAANAFAEAFPGLGATLDLCPTEAPQGREGWPPLPGSYEVLRYTGPIAVCTLNSQDLATSLAKAAPAGVAIVGTMHTENLGIERLIENTLANPNIRFLLVCGEDTKNAVGHLPGQSLVALSEHGVEPTGRIAQARGKRPFIKNLTSEDVEAFRRQVNVQPMIGEVRLEAVLQEASRLLREDPGPFAEKRMQERVKYIDATAARRLIPDPAGYLIVYPDRRSNRILVEHFSYEGVLDGVIRGDGASSVYTTVIERGWVTRLDHAAYLGRELARAEHSLQTGELYVQDRAAGDVDVVPTKGCGCNTTCKQGA